MAAPLERTLKILLAGAAALALLAAVAADAGAVSGPAVAAKPGHKGPLKQSRPVYDRLWKKKVSKRNKRWAKRVSTCESGRRPNAIGGGGLYRGAFQFSRPTWRSAPRSPGGDPIAFSYRTQAFVAVRLKERDGAGHWPNCR